MSSFQFVGRVFNTSLTETTKGKETCMHQRNIRTTDRNVVLCIQACSTSAEQESNHIRPKIENLYNVEAKVWLPVHAQTTLKTQRDESKIMEESAISNLPYYWCKHFRKRWKVNGIFVNEITEFREKCLWNENASSSAGIGGHFPASYGRCHQIIQRYQLSKFIEVTLS